MARRLAAPVAATVSAVVVLAALVFAGPVAAQQAEGYTVDQVDTTTWPTVRAVVSGPSIVGELDDAFVVHENGDPVPVDVVQTRGGPDMHVMVALDLSGSMEGEPIEQAKAALLTLVSELPAEADVGVIAFANSAVLVQPFTADRSAVLNAVAPLVPGGGTALHDSIVLSLDELAAAGGNGALVVLSDGADSTSLTPADAVLDRLAAADVETAIVTLKTPEFDGAVTETLAAAAGGTALPVEDPAAFVSAFATVASGLGNQWELRWRSASDAPTTAIEIEVAGTGLELTTTYERKVSESSGPVVAEESTVVSRPAPWLAASWIPWVAAALTTGGLAALVLMLRSDPTRVERREERRTNRQFEREQHRTMVSGVADRLTDISDHVLEGNNRKRSIDDVLDRAGLAVRAGEFIAFVVAASVAAIPVGMLLFGFPVGLLFALVPAVGTKAVLGVLIARRRKKFVEQLGDTLQLMAGSLTAGYGLGQTLDSVARETESPTSDEFSRVVMETRLGRSLEDALDAMSKRIQADDFDWVVDAIKIQASVGGNLSEIIGQVGDTIRARTRIRRQVQALTAEGKISALVLFVLPFGLCGFIAMSNPDYIAPLFSGGTGLLLLGGAGTLMFCGGLWLKKLVNPEF